MAVEEWWIQHVTHLADQMRQGGVQKFRVELTPRGTYEFEIEPIASPPMAERTGAVDPYAVEIAGVLADPYRIARAYGIQDPVIFQAIKKLLRCGRKHKGLATDVREAITTLERWEQMNAEDSQTH